MPTYTKSNSNPIWTASDVTWKSSSGVDNIAILRDPTDCLPTQYNSKYWMAYVARGGSGPEIGMASSTDLVSWTDENSALLLSGSSTWEQTALGSNTFLDMRNYSTSDDFWLVYHGQDGTGGSRYKQMGLAYSSDMTNWSRDSSNPIFSPNPPGGQGGEDFSVVDSGDSWDLLYEDEGSATSNGVRTAQTTNSLPDSGWSDQGTMYSSATDSGGIANPTLIRNPDAGAYEVLIEADPAGAAYSRGGTVSDGGFHNQSWTDEGEVITADSIPNGFVYDDSASENKAYYTDNTTEEGELAFGDPLTSRSGGGGTTTTEVPIWTKDTTSVYRPAAAGASALATVSTYPVDMTQPVGNAYIWYPTDAGSGTTLTDDNSGQNGTINGPDWVSGTWVGDYALQGVSSNSDYVQTTTWGDFGSRIGGNNWAIAYTIETTADDGAVWGYDDGSTERFAGGIGSLDSSVSAPAGQPCLEIRDSGNDVVWMWSTQTVNDGNPHRVVIQKTGGSSTTDSDMEFYIDGNGPTGTNTEYDQGYGSQGDFTEEVGLFAKNRGGSYQDYLDATIDNFTVWKNYGALSSQEITDDYNNQPWS